LELLVTSRQNSTQ